MVILHLYSRRKMIILVIQSCSKTITRVCSPSISLFEHRHGRTCNIVSVEIPAWVASDRKQLDILHASLIEQCRIMGFIPYPYILHRAHEIALVTYEEKRYVEQFLTNEFLKAGMEVEGNW